MPTKLNNELSRQKNDVEGIKRNKRWLEVLLSPMLW